MIFMLRVFGRSATRITAFGRNGTPRPCTTAFDSSASRAASAGTPGLVAQTTTSAEPATGSGTAMAAASTSLPVPISSVSISAGPVRLPANFITSSERP